MPQRTWIAMPPSNSTPFLLNSLERKARAVAIGASGGIGYALTDLLASEGFETVHVLSRSGVDRSLAGVGVGRIGLESEVSIAAAAARLGFDVRLGARSSREPEVRNVPGADISAASTSGTRKSRGAGE